MPRIHDKNKAPINLLTLLFGLSLLWACSDGSDSANNPGIPVDPEFPEYTVVELQPGADLETRALEALITAQPKTIIELPAGTYDFVGELSVSVDNIVLRGTGMDAAAGTVLRFGNLEIVARRCWKAPPEDHPENAGLLEISELKSGETPQRIFLGWMFSSSPGLSGLEHPVYDITVLDCTVKDENEKTDSTAPKDEPAERKKEQKAEKAKSTKKEKKR